MADDRQKPAGDASEATRRKGKPEADSLVTDAAPTDPFIVEKVFKDPVKVFSATAPADLHNHAAYVLDTNALLAPFAMGANPAADIVSVLNRLGESKRLYVPARAAREFARRRPDKLIEAYNDLHGVHKRLSYETLRCPMLEGLESYLKLQDASKAFQAVLRDYRKAIDDVLKELTDWPWEDQVSLVYRKLFDAGRVIDHDLSDDALLKDLRHRLDHRLPPGYKDAAKSDQGIGDVAIWHSILKIGELSAKSVVFVTDEMKPDWIVRTQGTAISARPELTYEFHHATGSHFGVVSFSEFLEKNDAKPETVEEAASFERSTSVSKGYDESYRDLLRLGEYVSGFCSAVVADDRLEESLQDVPLDVVSGNLMLILDRAMTLESHSVSPDERRALKKLQIVSLELSEALIPSSVGTQRDLSRVWRASNRFLSIYNEWFVSTL